MVDFPRVKPKLHWSRAKNSIFIFINQSCSWPKSELFELLLVAIRVSKSSNVDEAISEILEFEPLCSTGPWPQFQNFSMMVLYRSEIPYQVRPRSKIVSFMVILFCYIKNIILFAWLKICSLFPLYMEFSVNLGPLPV
jgi:hypothetical protein